MIPPPIAAPKLTHEDAAHLDSLATGFKVVGVLIALCGSFPWIHVFAGAAMIAQPPKMNTNGVATIAPSFMGGIFVAAGIGSLAFMYVLAYFVWKTSEWIDLRTRFQWCFGVSIAVMLFQPFGLILGVLALVVLNRPQVKAVFSS